jgi:hypothetical protein
VAEYALVTAVVASLALALSTIPESQLARRLPVTVAQAQALVSKTARANDVPAARARTTMARAPFDRVALRYLYAEGWIGGQRNAADCVFAKVTPAATTGRMQEAIRNDTRLRARLRRMKVTVAQAADALTRGTASAC